jgi:hypothetical protein
MRIPPFLLLVVAAGCGVARRPVNVPGPTSGPSRPVPEPAARPATEGGPWSFAWRAGTFAYEVVSEATIELAGDSLPAEQVRTTTYLTYTLAPGADAAADVTGLVDSVVVEGLRAGGRVAGPRDRALTAPVSFAARLDPARRRVEFPPLQSSLCASAAERTPAGAALVLARDLLVALPPSLAPRTTWRDTVASTVCRGDVPLSTTAVRTYEVEGLDQWEGQPALRVRRTSELLLAGQRGGRRPASVSGTGGATQRLFFDLAGRLLGATGESSTDVRMTAGEESGELRQRVRTRVALVAQR